MDRILLSIPFFILSFGATMYSAAENEWIALFDGETLDGWEVAAKPADRDTVYWKVVDGTITCDSRGHKEHGYVWLINQKKFKNFELKIKVRGFRNSPGNSGVQVRSRYDYREFWLDGPQVDIHPPAAWRTGLIYDETREIKRWIFPSLKNWEIDDSHAPRGWKWKFADEGDGWNDLLIICNGTNISTFLNGVSAAELKGDGTLNDANHRRHNVGMEGHIALQLHSGDELFVQFKDILIKTLK